MKKLRSRREATMYEFEQSKQRSIQLTAVMNIQKPILDPPLQKCSVENDFSRYTTRQIAFELQGLYI